jgi:hypothetical protein
MIDEESRVRKRLAHDAGGVEGMKPLASVLQDQYLGPVVDRGNRSAEAGSSRPIAIVATLPMSVANRLFEQRH